MLPLWHVLVKVVIEHVADVPKCLRDLLDCLVHNRPALFSVGSLLSLKVLHLGSWGWRPNISHVTMAPLSSKSDPNILLLLSWIVTLWASWHSFALARS